MARLQRKVTVWLAATGMGIVLAANPSGALPWGSALRPAFVSDVLGTHERPADAADVGAAGDQGTGPDPTIARPAGAHDGAAPSGADRPVPPTPTTTGAAMPPAGEPTTPAATAPAGDESLRATAVTSAHAGTDEPAPPVTPTEPPTEPRTEPTTAAPKRDDRTPASLSLACHLQAGATRADVACAWSGATPDGAARMLVLRGDGTVGRVLLNTGDLAGRAFTDHDAGAGRTFSYVVVFLGADGKTVAHSNGVNLTTPAAPTPPPSEPTTTVVHHPEPTTAAPRPAEPTTTVAGAPH